MGNLMQSADPFPVSQVAPKPKKKGLNDPFEALSSKYKAMWDSILKNHPWVKKLEPST